MWSKEEGQLDRKPWALNKHVPHRCSKLPNGLDSPWVYHRMESFASAAQHYWQMSLQEMQPMLVLEAWVSSRQQHPKSFHTERISNTGTSSILQRNKKIVNISTQKWRYQPKAYQAVKVVMPDNWKTTATRCQDH